MIVWIARPASNVFLVGPMYCSRARKYFFFFFFTKTTLKVGSIILFTHLEIILPQCFQFSIFSNKRYPNRPYIISHFKGVEEAVTVTCVFCLGDIEIKALVIGLTFSLSLMIPKYISR